MSIDFHYLPDKDITYTEEYIRTELSDEYEIISLMVDNNKTVTYFAINPKDLKKVVYQEDGYEYHLQDDGRYWHPILTRDDDLFEIENDVINDIATILNFELDLM